MAKVSSYVDDLNANLDTIPTRGPCSKYSITDEEGKVTRGKIAISWTDTPFKGIACKLDSPGYDCLIAAHKAVKGDVKPYSITGSLPLVGDMQAAGYDIQVRDSCYVVVRDSCYVVVRDSCYVVVRDS